MDEITIKRQKAYAKRKADEAEWQRTITIRQRTLALQQKADADLDKASTVYIRTVVRKYGGAGSSIIPWSQDTTLPNTGVTVNATRTNDGIVL